MNHIKGTDFNGIFEGSTVQADWEVINTHPAQAKWNTYHFKQNDIVCFRSDKVGCRMEMWVEYSSGYSLDMDLPNKNADPSLTRICQNRVL